MNSRQRLTELLENHVEQWKRSNDLMRRGLMGTRESRNGLMVDTTAETIADADRRIADFEATLKAWAEDDAG